MLFKKRIMKLKQYLLLTFLTQVHSESECALTGTWVDSAHAGTGAPKTVSINGATFNFTGGVEDPFPNNITTVAVTTTSNDWMEVTYHNGLGCSLAKVNGADIELTAPLATCATSWPTTDPAFTGKAVDGTLVFCDLWIFGVMGAMLGTFLSTLGLGLQKLTHEKVKAEEKEIVNYCNHPYWLLGIGCLVVDAVLDVWTFGLAPASLLAPMASMVLVWNVVTSPCLVGEKITKRGMTGTLIIISGSICATIFSQHDTPSYTLADFGQRWSSAEVIIYEICVVCIFMSCKYGLHRMSVNADARQYVGEEESTHNEATTSSDVNVDLESIAAAASANEPKTAEDEKIESMALNYAEGSREYNIAQFVMAMMSGMLGGQSIIFAKTVVELLKATFFGPEGDTYNAFASWPFYLFLCALIGVLMTQTQVLNVAMHNFDSLNVIPIFITFYQVFGIIGGAIYYKEFDDFGVAQAFMFPIGCCISFSGIWVLSKGPKDDEDGEMEVMVDEDETAAGSVSPHGTRSTPALTSGGTPRERYRSRMSTAAAGPLLGFLMKSTIIDRDNISESIKKRRRSTVRGRNATQSMTVRGTSKDGPSTPTKQGIVEPKRMSTV